MSFVLGVSVHRYVLHNIRYTPCFHELPLKRFMAQYNKTSVVKSIQKMISKLEKTFASQVYIFALRERDEVSGEVLSQRIRIFCSTAAWNWKQNGKRKMQNFWHKTEETAGARLTVAVAAFVCTIKESNSHQCI